MATAKSRLLRFRVKLMLKAQNNCERSTYMNGGGFHSGAHVSIGENSRIVHL